MEHDGAAGPHEGAAPAPAPAAGRRSAGRRLRDAADGASARGRAVARQVEALRPDTPLLDAGFECWERDSAAAGSLLGGALAFRLFLLSVPLTLLVYSGLGFASASDSAVVSDAGAQIGLSESVLATMDRVGADASRSRWVVLVVGLWALVLATRALVKALRVVHVVAWDLPRRRRGPRWQEVAGAVGVVAAVVVVAIGSAWARDRTPGGGVTISVVLGVVWAAGWLGLSRVLPRADDAPWTALVPGAVLMGLASQGLHAATVFYLAGRVARMSSTYGPLGVAAVMLLWLFILARAAVVAAVVDATLWDRRRRGLASVSPVDVRSILGAAEPGASAGDRPTD